MSLTIGKVVGQGGYGTVHFGRWQGQPCAVKQVRLSESEFRQLAIQQEIELLEVLRHRHIIQFYRSFHHDGKLVIIMDYAEGGSLQRAIEDTARSESNNSRSNGGDGNEGGKWSTRLLSWDERTRIVQEIARALAYMHSENILHRDLKSANVLLTRHMEVRLCDFGLATVKTTTMTSSTTNNEESGSGDGGDIRGGGLKGTLRWMAPELLGLWPKYSTKSDMYALGMVMWEMAALCTMPFKAQANQQVVMAAVLGGGREILPSDTPVDYRSLVERCWDQDPAKRPDAKEMIIVGLDNDEEPQEDVIDWFGLDQGTTVSVSSCFTCSELSAKSPPAPLPQPPPLPQPSSVSSVEDEPPAHLEESIVHLAVSATLPPTDGNFVDRTTEEALISSTGVNSRSSSSPLSSGVTLSGVTINHDERFDWQDFERHDPESHTLVHHKIHGRGRDVSRDHTDAILSHHRRPRTGQQQDQLSLPVSPPPSPMHSVVFDRQQNPDISKEGTANNMSHLWQGGGEGGPKEAFTDPTLVLGNRIGRGIFGVIFRGKWAHHRVCAIKKFYDAYASENHDVLQREIAIMSRLRHGHVIQFFGTSYHEGSLVMVSEVAEGGSLQSALQTSVLRGSEDDIDGWHIKQRLVQEMASAVAYIHDQGIIHRNLRAGNFMLTKDLRAKLTSFALALEVPLPMKEGYMYTVPKEANAKGSIRWMAPELLEMTEGKFPRILPTRRCSVKSDMYSFGMTIWQLVSHSSLPFRHLSTDVKVCHFVRNGGRERIPNRTPPSFRAWIERCFDTDPAMRPRAEELLDYDSDTI